MYNNPYMPSYNQNFNQQSINDRIDNQIAQLQQMKEQMKHNQQPAINQTFQLAPQQSGIRYVNSIDEVKREVAYVDTPFFSKDMSIVWIKNNKNEIRTYELNEIIPKDNKDLRIEYLEAQIEELKKGMKNNEPDANINEPTTNTDKSEKSTDISAISKHNAKSK